VARCGSVETLSKSRFWSSRLAGGLPADFDYQVVKSVEDAKALILLLPNCDRGQAAVGLYLHRDLIGAAAAYGGIMVAWDHDHREIVEAFGSPAEFLAALKNIAPSPFSQLPNRVDIWRGAVLSKNDALQRSNGLSWTRNRNVACWFALHDYVPELQPSLVPVVLHANVDRSVILAQHKARAEQEVILDVNRLVVSSNVSMLDGIDDTPLFAFQHRVADLWPDGEEYDRLIVNWRLASARYERWKRLLELRRSSLLQT
jgi:hypothetical protein